jgi:putative transposase
MGTRQRFAIPDGWVARGFRFEVQPTTSEQPGRIAQSFGGRRFAYNWALAQVKANLDARTTDPAVPALQWNLPALRKAWNQAKDAVAPWWAATSKEAYASGIADLVVALHNWSDSKGGRRAGARVGFPRFKARHRDHGRVRFTTGAMRLEPDRRHLVLPVIGRLRSKENTRRLQRLAAKGRARILSMTLSEQGGRLFVAVQAIVCQQPRTPSEPQARCGIDLGVGKEWAVVAHHDETIERVAHPTPWVETHKQRRRVARQRSRRIVGSRGHRQTNAKLAALDRRAANLRTQSIHTLTTRLSSRYGTVIIEDLDVAAMGRGMGRRAFRRTVAQAGIGRVRPTLAYKTAWAGGQLAVADRWFASSKTHHGCGGYLADLTLSQRVWVCPCCEQTVDRNANAARNLRDWTGPVAADSDGDRDVQRGGVAAPVPLVGDHGGQAHAPGGACEAPQDHPRWREPTTPEPNPASGAGEEPRAGVSARERSQTLTELVTEEEGADGGGGGAGADVGPAAGLDRAHHPALRLGEDAVGADHGRLLDRLGDGGQ